MQFRVTGYDETFTLLSGSITFAEARAVEKKTGLAFAEIGSLPQEKRTADVTQALLWVSMKRLVPTLEFGDLDNVDLIGGIEWLPEESDEESPDPTGADADD